MIQEAFEFLQSKLHAVPQFDYPVTSRIHALHSFFTASGKPCFVKREDELGFGISGSKFRKYRTLIPYLMQQGIQEACVIGGAFSNHILSLVQLLIENGIQPTLFLKGPAPTANRGNFLFTQLLVPPSAIHWIAKNEWQDVHDDVASYAQKRPNACVIPEGATLFAAFLGALTLPLDITRNEKDVQFTFDHLFLDVGTGYSAAALLLGFAFFKKQTMCHLMLLADTSEAFMRTLRKLHTEFEVWLGTPCPFPTQFRFIESTLLRSFGSTNKKLFECIITYARAEGFFLDPIYSAKLFYQAKELLQVTREIDGKVLFVHSGGALSLSGFQEKFMQILHSN